MKLILSLMAGIIIAALPGDQGQNLLDNESFEEGWYDVSATQQCPDRWRLHWTAGEQMGDTENLSARPESRVLPKNQVPSDEHDLYFYEGEHTVKVFWSDEPIHVALAQDVDGLERGRRYRFTVPAYVDTFEWDEENRKKEKPSDPYAAQVRLGAGPKRANWQDASIVNYGAWQDEGSKSPFFLAPITLQFEFVATAPEMTVFIEYRSKWSLDNSGIFVDALRLEPLGVAWTPTPTRLSPSSDLATATPSFEKQTTAKHASERQTVTKTAASNTRVTKTPTVSPTASPLPASPTPEPASVCVLVYHDQDNDGHRDSGEKILPEVVLTLTSNGDTVEKRITGNASECFVGLSPGTYKLFQTPPPGYEGTPRQKIKLYPGTQLSVQFANAHKKDEETSNSEFDRAGRGNQGKSKRSQRILAPVGAVLLGSALMVLIASRK